MQKNNAVRLILIVQRCADSVTMFYHQHVFYQRLKHCFGGLARITSG